MNTRKKESADLAQIRELLKAHDLTEVQIQPQRLPRLLERVFRAIPVKGVEKRRFGPAGFTVTPAVQALLAPYEPTVGPGGQPNGGLFGLVYIDLLPSSRAVQLHPLLPRANIRERHEGAPSFEQFIQLGRMFPELRFCGYRITPDRPDERISITGYYYPSGHGADRVYRQARRFARSEPDEYHPAQVDGETLIFAWWD